MEGTFDLEFIVRVMLFHTIFLWPSLRKALPSLSFTKSSTNSLISGSVLSNCSIICCPMAEAARKRPWSIEFSDSFVNGES